MSHKQMWNRPNDVLMTINEFVYLFSKYLDAYVHVFGLIHVKEFSELSVVLSGCSGID